MTKRIFLALSALGSCCCACGSSAQQKGNCQQFRTGSFSYHFRHPVHGFSFLMTRQGDIQTETNQQTGAVSKFAVTWLTDCTYELHLLATTEHFPKEIEELRKKSPLKTEILSWTDTYYLFRSQRPGSNLILTDTIWVNK